MPAIEQYDPLVCSEFLLKKAHEKIEKTLRMLYINWYQLFGRSRLRVGVCEVAQALCVSFNGRGAGFSSAEQPFLRFPVRTAACRGRAARTRQFCQGRPGVSLRGDLAPLLVGPALQKCDVTGISLNAKSLKITNGTPSGGRYRT